MSIWLSVILCALLGYLLGCINPAYLIARARGFDIRSRGSGNAGASNAVITMGKAAGVFSAIIDIFKAWLAVCLATRYFTALSVGGIPVAGEIAGVACMLGHVFPIYFQFKGGKGAATSVGIYAVCCPMAIILGLCAFALVLLTTKIVSLGSLAAALTVVVLSIVFFAGDGNIFVVAALSIAMGIIVFAKHKDNIKRLIRGEEKKLTIGGKKNG